MANNYTSGVAPTVSLKSTDTAGVHTPYVILESGNVDVLSIAVPTTFYMGQLTIATSGTELVLGSSQALVIGVTVKAISGNTGSVWVGTNPVTVTTGFELAAGEQVFIAVDNIADVYVDTTTNGDKVSFIGN